METLNQYPAYRLLAALFGVAIIAHAVVLSDLQTIRQRSSYSSPKTLSVSLTNTWSPPINKPAAKPVPEIAREPVTAKPQPEPVAKTLPETAAAKPQPEPAPPTLEPEKPPVSSSNRTVMPPPEPVIETIAGQKIKPASPSPAVVTAVTEPPQPPAKQAVVPDTQHETVKVAKTGASVAATRLPERKAETVNPGITAEPETAQQPQIDWNMLVNQFISRINIQEYYPSAALRRRQQGTVTLRVGLSQRIEVEAVDIADSSRYASLDNAALDLIRTNRGQLEAILRAGGVKVKNSTVLRLPIQFRLR